MRTSSTLLLGALLALAVGVAGPASAADTAAPDALAEGSETAGEAPAQPGAESATEGSAAETGAPDAGAVAAAVDAGMAQADPAAGASELSRAEEEAAAAPADAEAAGEVAPPAAPAPAEAQIPAGAGPAAGESRAALGALGYDEEGRPGRIHVVVRGDTLWDISEAYLGTPWIWPSVWQDNRDIENPHRIHPGDRIWITDSEMRKVSAEEAARLLAGRPAAPDAAPVEEALPAAPAVPLVAQEQRTVRVSARESSGLISAESLESAASIVDKIPNRVFLVQEDLVYLGLGEGDVHPGDTFTIFRQEEPVRDPDTARLLGYHVNILGWLEVQEVHGETSVAEIRMSSSEIEVGDRLIPREEPLVDIPVQPGPEGVDGKISFFPQSRVLMGTIDFVYLNRGSLDGLEVGSPLEVYRGGGLVTEDVRHQQVRVPERVVADMLVVRTRPESAVALVTHTETELELGDHFRGAR